MLKTVICRKTNDRKVFAVKRLCKKTNRSNPGISRTLRV